MSKKKNTTSEETATSEAEVMEEADGETDPSPQDVSGDHPSPEAVEERAAEVELSPDLDHMQKELAASDDRHLRLVAEFTNYRRRAENELSEAWTRGQADMLRSFVEGLDDLQRVGA